MTHKVVTRDPLKSERIRAAAIRLAQARVRLLEAQREVARAEREALLAPIESVDAVTRLEGLRSTYESALAALQEDLRRYHPWKPPGSVAGETARWARRRYRLALWVLGLGDAARALPEVP